MKKQVLMAGLMIAVLALTGCKSKQNSMQSLYDNAVEQDVASAVEEVAPVKPARPAANDRTEKVTTVNSSEASMLKSFNIVVGSFGQMTNAEAMKNKMIGRGYQSFLVRNEAGLLRCIAGGYDSRERAESVRDNIRSTYSNESGTCAEAWLLVPQQ